MSEEKDQRTAKGAMTDEALGIVKKYAYGGAGIGLLPLPLVDLVGLLALQLAMAHRLARLYKVDFPENVVRSLIVSLVGYGTAAFTFPLVTSALKLIPGVGQVSGMVGGVTLGGASTYAVGRVFVQHFDSGGTFLTLDPERVRDYYEDAMREGKEELGPKRP